MDRISQVNRPGTSHSMHLILLVSLITAGAGLLAIQALERRTAKLEAQLGAARGAAAQAAQAPVRVNANRRQ
jgi:hypothetical protein